VRKDWFYKLLEEELDKDAIKDDDRYTSIALIVSGVLLISLFLAHQSESTGFFTETFGMIEVLLLYGNPIYWIVTSTLILINRKYFSRLLDIFGGLIFATVGITWLTVVFPFEFAYFAEVLPQSLKFLVQWISNDIARVLMVLGVIVHLVLTFFASILHLYVHRPRAQAF
jgi:hypothetical protein